MFRGENAAQFRALKRDLTSSPIGKILIAIGILVVAIWLWAFIKFLLYVALGVLAAVLVLKVVQRLGESRPEPRPSYRPRRSDDPADSMEERIDNLESILRGSKK